MTLVQVRKAADEVALARERLQAQIRKAHSEGQSLRAVAEAAGLSHEQVRRLVSR